jgi:urease accessory protein
MTPAQFVHTLQLMDSMFPVGAFAYSDGLESAAASGLVHDAASLGGWLDHMLEAVFIPCEGLALCRCVRAAGIDDWDSVRSIDEELTALRPAAATRASSRFIGRRLLTTYAHVFKKGAFSAALEIPSPCNAPVAYAAVLSDLGLEPRDALLAFGYTRMTGIVSAGLRLIALGQQQGQTLLTGALDRLPAAVETVVNMGGEPLRCFAPLVDIQQMNHRYVYSRLFRS